MTCAASTAWAWRFADDGEVPIPTRNPSSTRSATTYKSSPLTWRFTILIHHPICVPFLEALPKPSSNRWGNQLPLRYAPLVEAKGSCHRHRDPRKGHLFQSQIFSWRNHLFKQFVQPVNLVNLMNLVCTLRTIMFMICETSVYWEALAVRNLQIPSQRIKFVCSIASWSSYVELFPPVTCPLTQFIKIKQEAKQITSNNKKRKIEMKTGTNKKKKHIQSVFRILIMTIVCVSDFLMCVTLAFKCFFSPFSRCSNNRRSHPPSGNYMAFHLLQLLVSTLSKA